ERLPAEVREILTELGDEYSRTIGEETAARYERALRAMEEEGATITELPPEEKLEWIARLPDIAGHWADLAEKRGHPAREVLGAFIAAVRDRGVEPLRRWDLPQ